MARKLSWYRTRESVDPRLHALPYAGTRCSIALRCREAHRRNRTHVNVSAALLPYDDSKTRCASGRRRRRTARAAAGRMAPAGTVSQHSESQFGPTMELSIQNTRTAERQSDQGHLHGIRSAAADQTTA